MWVTWKGVREAAEFASYIGVLLAIAVAMTEYYLNAQQVRVQHSIDLLSQFNAPELRADRLAIEKPWLEHDLTALSAVENNADALEQLAHIILTDNPDVELSLIYIVDLLDVVGRCVKEKICDGTIINQQIGSYADSVSCLYGNEIERLRATKLLPRLGDGMSYIEGGASCAR